MALPAPKLIPTHLHELRYAWHVRQHDREMATDAGRSRYWNETLPRQCAADSMISLLESTLHLPGDVIECGVYRGGSLMKIARTLKDKAPDKRLLGLDSFGGFPEQDVLSLDVGKKRSLGGIRKKFRFVGDTQQRLRRNFEMYGVNAELVPGFFSETLSKVTDRTFCFIHLDVDIYSSYIECFEALWDRLTPGGVMVFDECDAQAWPGATRAIREFFGPRPVEVQVCLDRELASYHVRKPAASSAAA